MYRIKTVSEDFIVEEIPDFSLEDKGEYSIYILEKKEYNSEDAISDICRRFRVPRKNIGSAGNKDKTAETKQYISIKGKVPDLKEKEFSIRFIGFLKKPISTGGLIGNRFTIIVRNITKRPKKIGQILNYFDEQRFGKNNLEIGLGIIRKDFRTAAGLIDLETVKSSLLKNPNDYVNAIRNMPLKVLNLYVHAVQSYIFNEVAADIAKKYGHHKSVYSHGDFIFTVEKIANLKIPLVAFDTELRGAVGEHCTRIMKKLGITERDFVIRQISGITPLGGERDLCADVKDLSIGNLSDDDLNPGMKKSTVKFTLGKGSYATIVIRAMNPT